MENKGPKSKAKQEVSLISRFAGVGVLNTALDFTILNALSSSYVGLGIITANIISTTVAMIFSFFANKKLVFKDKSTDHLYQAVVFVVITGFGLWVLQTGVIYFLTRTWTTPLKDVYSLVKSIGLGHTFSESFVIKNGAKVVATLVSMTWNYIAYKKLLFKQP